MQWLQKMFLRNPSWLEFQPQELEMPQKDFNLMRLLIKIKTMTQIKNNFLESIGNTPLIKLKAASEITGCHIFGKAEYLNPGGSVKDRAALALIKDAQEKKLISEGGIVVEGTAGNTGIGLCLLGNSLGYKTIIAVSYTHLRAHET